MNTLTIDKFKKMFEAALVEVKANEEYFSKLDAVTGDGDHGTAIVSAMQAAYDGANGTDLKTMLNEMGFAVMLNTSGSTSTLMGGFLLGMSDMVSGAELNADEVKTMFKGGVEGVMKNTKAVVGDKTMMDALIPAVDAIVNSPSTEIKEMLLAASEAAKTGAEATVQMKANFGRARNYGERSIGTADAGACSWAMMFDAFYKAF